MLELTKYFVEVINVRKVLSSKTRLIILNSPHNPTGAVFTDADISELKNILQDTDVLILSDEVDGSSVIRSPQ